MKIRTIADEIIGVTPVSIPEGSHWETTDHEDGTYTSLLIDKDGHCKMTVTSKQKIFNFGESGHDFVFGFYLIDENGMHVYANQEIDKYNSLLERIRKSKNEDL